MPRSKVEFAEHEGRLGYEAEERSEAKDFETSESNSSKPKRSLPKINLPTKTDGWQLKQFQLAYLHWEELTRWQQFVYSKEEGLWYDENCYYPGVDGEDDWNEYEAILEQYWGKHAKQEEKDCANKMSREQKQQTAHEEQQSSQQNAAETQPNKPDTEPSLPNVASRSGMSSSASAECSAHRVIFKRPFRVKGPNAASESENAETSDSAIRTKVQTTIGRTAEQM